MNEYLKNLEKIEFVITYACTGKCKHCSQGEHVARGEHISAEVAADAVRKIAERYDIKTVMTFGGEPLLYPESVFAIHRAATEMNIPKRQVITNGYFTKDVAAMKKVAEKLAAAGVNDLLLSVDAFHQKTIPSDAVKTFAAFALDAKIPIRTQPAWLAAREDKNPYNEKTREILKEFEKIGIFAGEGNIIFPEGNALKYFKEYFTDKTVENPYVENPKDVKCASFEPDGSVLSGNVYNEEILDILEKYNG